MSGYKPTRRDRIGVPVVNLIARLLLSKAYRDTLANAISVGVAANRAWRESGPTS